MLVPFWSYYSWSNDRILERAISSFEISISYPELRLVTLFCASNKSDGLGKDAMSYPSVKKVPVRAQNY